MTRILLVVLLALPQCLLANPVQFDIPQLAPATTVPVGQIAPRLPESLHVRLQLDISTLVASGFSGRVEEATIKILAHRPLVQVADFWPRTEMVSQYSSMISVSEEQDRLKQASINAIGGYPGVGSAKSQAYFHDHLNRDVQYQQAPPMQLLSAAGTLHRRSGVYFKLRSTPQVTLEGLRTFVVVLEVPSAWRGDLLEVQANAYGKHKEDSKGMQELGQERFWVAVYRDDDQQAASFAIGFAQQQSKLRILARQNDSRIRKQAYPTPIHRFGEAIDIYEPLVSTDYLNDWMFGSTLNQPNGLLPVDLRAAMLDFSDSRSVMESISGPQLDLRTAGVANHQKAKRF